MEIKWEKAHAKWVHKECERCGKDFTYHKDTTADRIPRLCMPCREKAGALRELSDNENARFVEACNNIDMSDQERKAFSGKFFHEIPRDDRLHMKADEIMALARDWLDSNRGKFRREDQRN